MPPRPAFARSVVPAVLAFAAAGCVTGGGLTIPGAGTHPADATARVPVFKPAPDPLVVETTTEAPPPPPSPPPEHAGHEGHEHHERK